MSETQEPPRENLANGGNVDPRLESRFDYQVEHQSDATAELSGVIDEILGYLPEKSEVFFTPAEDTQYFMLLDKCLESVHEYSRAFGISDNHTDMVKRLKIALAVNLGISQYRNLIKNGVTAPEQLIDISDQNPQLIAQIKEEEWEKFIKLSDQGIIRRMAESSLRAVSSPALWGKTVVTDFFDDQYPDIDNLPPPTDQSQPVVLDTGQTTKPDEYIPTDDELRFLKAESEHARRSTGIIGQSPKSERHLSTITYRIHNRQTFGDNITDPTSSP